MSASYFVRVKNRAGVKQEEFDTFLSLSYTKTVNDTGLLRMDVPYASPFDTLFDKDYQIEVWREDVSNGITPYCDFYGFFRGKELRHPSGSQRGVLTAICPGQMHFLKRAVIAWPAATANRTQFVAVPTETILKTLVRYNATSDATLANGRIRTVGTWSSYVSYAADGATGTTISANVAHRNLLEALQELAVAGGLEFDLVKTGAQAWQFQTRLDDAYDLSADIKFSIDWGNIENPELNDSSLTESTVAIVGGSGQEAIRTFVTRTGPNYVADYNDSEIFVNQTQQGTSTGALQAYGDARLSEIRAKQDFHFKVRQTEADMYGRDYCISGRMGELVKAQFGGLSVTKKIRSVAVNIQSIQGDYESIDLEMVTV